MARNFAHDDVATRREAFKTADRDLNKTEGDCLVLSHEVLGNLSRSVSALARRAIRRSGFDAVVIVGYTRVQSSYFLAEHKQWSFRSTKRLQADTRFVERFGLDASRFTPIERCMIAHACRSAKNRNVRNWRSYYNQLLRQTSALGHEVRVTSNHIPTKDHPYSLVQDFFERAGIEINDQTLADVDQLSNRSFSPHLCDAIALHYGDESLDSSWLPGPHESNGWLVTQGGQIAEELELAPLVHTDWLMQSAAGLIDQSYRGSNVKYCDLMGVDESYFDSSLGERLTRPAFLVIVREVEAARSKEAVENYRDRLLEMLGGLRR